MKALFAWIRNNVCQAVKDGVRDAFEELDGEFPAALASQARDRLGLNAAPDEAPADGPARNGRAKAKA